MRLIEEHLESIKALCRKHHVERIYLFGSVLNAGFSENSDLDFLVKFKPIELSAYFENYINLKEELKKLLNREIDLVEEQTLKNPILIRSINRNKELLYG